VWVGQHPLLAAYGVVAAAVAADTLPDSIEVFDVSLNDLTGKIWTSLVNDQ
jgi:hypothetical protein